MSPPGSKSQTPFSLRVAEPKDAAAVAKLGSHTFATTFGYSLPPNDLARFLAENYTPSAILKDIADPAATLTVACDVDETVMGFCQMRRDSHEPCIADKPKPVELQRLYVSPDHHGKGVARALMDALEERARKEGFETLWLGVWEENLKAQGIYGRFGFVKCGTHDFTMGECVQTDWIMFKAL